MEQVMKHYGNAILVAIVLLLLGSILIAILAKDGVVAVQFQNMIKDFFDNMNAMRG